MNSVVEKAFEVELYHSINRASISELEECQNTLKSDKERAKYVNKILAVHKQRKLQSLLDEINVKHVPGELNNMEKVRKEVMDKIIYTLGIKNACDAIDWIRQNPDNIFPEQTDDIYKEIRKRIGSLHSIQYLENQKRLKEAKKDVGPILEILGLKEIDDIHAGIQSYLSTTKEGTLIISELMTYTDDLEKWFIRYLYDDEPSISDMVEYLHIGKTMTIARTIRRYLYRIITLNGVIAESVLIGVAKLNFVFGLIYANVTSDFLYVHVQRFSLDMTDDVYEIGTGLKRWALAISMVAFLAFIVYETLRVYGHLPRCNRNNQLCNFALTKRSRRWRKAFMEGMARDAQHDDEYATHQFDYDSENIDPYAGIYYFHRKEKEELMEITNEEWIPVGSSWKRFYEYTFGSCCSRRIRQRGIIEPKKIDEPNIQPRHYLTKLRKRKSTKVDHKS